LNNINNRNNNRRRGRNNRGSGGGSQGNRIDSRARGNASQMLEKYKKLAHDASLNGDRVQTEYYLQFADHYFRVLADNKSPKDEQRGPRSDRDQDDDYDSDTEESSGRNDRNQPRRSDYDDVQRASEGDADDGDNPNGSAKESGGLDPASLPPAIGAERNSDEEKAAPLRRTRRPRASGDDEALEVVS